VAAAAAKKNKHQPNENFLYKSSFNQREEELKTKKPTNYF
jgi:hypothetical protein